MNRAVGRGGNAGLPPSLAVGLCGLHRAGLSLLVVLAFGTGLVRVPPEFESSVNGHNPLPNLPAETPAAAGPPWTLLQPCDLETEEARQTGVRLVWLWWLNAPQPPSDPQDR